MTIKAEELLNQIMEISYEAIQGPDGDGVKSYQRSVLEAKHSKIVRLITENRPKPDTPADLAVELIEELGEALRGFTVREIPEDWRPVVQSALSKLDAWSGK